MLLFMPRNDDFRSLLLLMGVVLILDLVYIIYEWMIEQRRRVQILIQEHIRY